MAELIRCTVPGCKKELPPEAMWIPDRQALKAANGGRRVALPDLSKHALCGHHGHLLRQAGEGKVKVYRYGETVRRETEDVKRRQAEDLSFKHFASRYTR